MRVVNPGCARKARDPWAVLGNAFGVGEKKMAFITVKLQTQVRRTFRVEQVAGMFDVPLEERLGAARRGRKPIQALAEPTREAGAPAYIRHELTAEVPGREEEWTIGAIVGPSGSGKTTLAEA